MIGFCTNVVRQIAFNLQPRQTEFNIGSRLRVLDDFNRIMQRKWIKYCFKIVKAVPAFAKNVQAKVDLAVGKENQERFGVWGLAFGVVMMYDEALCA